MATNTTKRDSMDATTEGIETQLKASTFQDAPSPKQPPTFLSLPVSIRNTIYSYVLDTELVNTGLPNVSYTHSLSTTTTNKDPMLSFHASRSPFPILSSLFTLNRQISSESLRYFYSTNLFIRFEIYTADARHAKNMLIDSGLLFSPAHPSKLERCKQHALDFMLVEKNGTQKRSAVMFPAQYLPRLINYLEQASAASKSWAPAHTLSMSVLNTYGFKVARVQGDLLELFRGLTNFASVSISPSNLLPGYAEGLKSSMSLPKFTAENWLSSVTSLADSADAARANAEYTVAEEYAQAAIIGMTYGYLTRAEVLHSAPESFTREVQRLRWRTELGLSISLLLQVPPSPSTSPDDNLNPHTSHTLLLSERNSSLALSLCTDSPSPASNPWFSSLPVELIPPNKSAWFTDRERAQTWFVLAKVHMRLGENLFACGGLERALGLWRDDEENREEGEGEVKKIENGNGAEDGEEEGTSEAGVGEEEGIGGRKQVEKAFEEARMRVDADRENMWVGKVRPGSALEKAARVARGYERR